MSEIPPHPFHEMDDDDITRRFADAHWTVVSMDRQGAKNIAWLHSLAVELTRRGIDRREALDRWGIQR